MEPCNNVILMVEDNDDDFRLFMMACKAAKMANPIFRCVDGDDALDFLYRHKQYVDPAQAPRPAVILLDLNLPKTDGRQVLTEIKHQESLKQIPVIMLTGSSAAADIEACYQAGANSYITKPVTLEGFLRAIQLLKDYWFEINLLPRSSQ